MNPFQKAWRTIVGPGNKGGGDGRLPPVPLGWQPRARSASAVRTGADRQSEPADDAAHPPVPEPPAIVVRPPTPIGPRTVAPAPPAPEARSMSAPGGTSAGAGTAGPRLISRAGALIATEADVAMMKRALTLAREAARLGEVPIGAVVFDTASGRVLGEAFNRREIDKDPTAHAELLAIRQAAATLGDWRLNHCTLAVTLEPCVMCSGLIVNARLGRLVYGARDPKAGAAESLYRLTSDPRLNHRVMPVPGVLETECARILSDFFAKLREKTPAAAGADPTPPPKKGVAP